MLIHQIPPKPAYLRVKIGRHLARIGAVALKNTVYLLPRSDGAQEDFQWVLREVVSAGGEATLLDARLVDGLTDPEVRAFFNSARDSDYLALVEEIRVLDAVVGEAEQGVVRDLGSELNRLERRFEEILSLDFFGASSQQTAQGLLAALRARITPIDTTAGSEHPEPPECRGRTWVTRTGIHVDRIASAWLIRRCIDPEAKFKFVSASGYRPEPGELRFDMFEAEFSHEGDLCTFEVLCTRFQLEVPGLRAIAELVHDIDLKDGKFARSEASGLAAQIAGLCLTHREDEARLARGAELFEELLTYFARKKGST